jgi:hypothetical protein
MQQMPVFGECVKRTDTGQMDAKSKFEIAAMSAGDSSS